MAPIKIAIADDHAIVRAGLRSVLESEPDMQVVGEAACAWTAIQVVRDTKPTVVLLDIGMPGCEWIQAIDRIRSHSPTAKILVVTGRDDQVYLRSALAAGCAGYFVKGPQSRRIASCGPTSGLCCSRLVALKKAAETFSCFSLD